jgi:hypothetical protein
VIGLLERHGLKERAQAWIAKIHSATAGRLLIVYLFVREATAALGLTSLADIRKWCAAAGADGGRGGGKTLGPLPGNSLSPARDVGGDRQRRPVLRRRYFRRLRRDHLYAQLYAGVGGIQTEPLHIALWGSRRRSAPSDPFRAPVATRSPSPARAGR